MEEKVQTCISILWLISESIALTREMSRNEAKVGSGKDSKPKIFEGEKDI
jgi:hypothetical protein